MDSFQMGEELIAVLKWTARHVIADPIVPRTVR